MWDTLIIDPMTNALLLLYYVLGNNFLLAIAVFTLLIRVVTLPLNLRQQRTSMRMQALQPQIQAIQKKYKDNPAKMQEEFRKVGYNPAETVTGCLPLLIQFPILIGLYRAILILLGSTPQALFELTERVYPNVAASVNLATLLPIANKFTWLNLAQPDPYFVLPVLVVATMFLQQKLMMPPTPKTADGKKPDNPMASMNQSMQYTMPIMFGFFSLSFPSGLSIYFILSNVIGIAQGMLTKNAMPKPAPQAVVADSREQAVPEKPVAAAKNSSNGQQPRPAARRSGSESKRKRRSAKR